MFIEALLSAKHCTFAQRNRQPHHVSSQNMKSQKPDKKSNYNTVELEGLPSLAYFRGNGLAL
jgi:hypothetical protein